MRKLNCELAIQTICVRTAEAQELVEMKDLIYLEQELKEALYQSTFRNDVVVVELTVLTNKDVKRLSQMGLIESTTYSMVYRCNHGWPNVTTIDENQRTLYGQNSHTDKVGGVPVFSKQAVHTAIESIIERLNNNE